MKFLLTARSPTARSPTTRPYACMLLGGLLCLGCVGTKGNGNNKAQASPYRDLRSLRAIFKPMTTDSAKRHIICDYLEVDLSRELYTEIIATYNDLFHQRRLLRAKDNSRPGPESTYTFINSKGRFGNPLRFMISQATFTVLGRAVFRLYGKGKARWDLTASGHVSILEAGKSRDSTSVRVSNGAWRETAR